MSHKKKRAFYESQLGKTYPVLFEAEQQEADMYGFTNNYVKVKTPYNKDLVNTVHEVKLSEIDRDGLFKIEFIH